MINSHVYKKDIRIYRLSHINYSHKLSPEHFNNHGQEIVLQYFCSVIMLILSGHRPTYK